MALMLHGARIGDATSVPNLKDGEVEAYRVRAATEDDLPFIARVDAESARRYLVTYVRDEALWTYELRGRSDESGECRRLGVVETTDGDLVGFLIYRESLPDRGSWYVTVFEVKAGVSWLAVAPSVLRQLAATLDEAGAGAERGQARRLIFDLGPEHPLFQVTAPYLPQTYNPYAWYVRVADLPDFLRHITPVLERRLAESVAVGHSGEVKVGFYRKGLRLRFERGRLTGVEDWPQTSEEISDARFPDLTFLQLLFGYRALEELEYALPDCRAPSNEARVILKALFPKQPSSVWPVA
jgi:hypothetical protein